MSIIKILDTWVYKKRWLDSNVNPEPETCKLTIEVSGSMGGQLYVFENSVLVKTISNTGSHEVTCTKGSKIVINSSSWDEGYSYTVFPSNRFTLNEDTTVSIEATYTPTTYPVTVNISGYGGGYFDIYIDGEHIESLAVESKTYNVTKGSTFEVREGSIDYDAYYTSDTMYISSVNSSYNINITMYQYVEETAWLSIAVSNWKSRVENWYKYYDITVSFAGNDYTGEEIAYSSELDKMVVYEVERTVSEINQLEGTTVTVSINGYVNDDWGWDYQTWTGTLRNGQCICT